MGRPGFNGAWNTQAGTPATKQRFTVADRAKLREYEIRLFRDSRAEGVSDTAACRAIVPQPGCLRVTRRNWYQQAEGDAAKRSGLSSAGIDRSGEMERDNLGQGAASVGA